LIDGVFSGKEGASAVELVNEAAETPHITFVGIASASQKHLRGTIPSCCDELSHDRSIEKL